MPELRRPRATRMRRGKPLIIGERDVAIFRWLARYRYLPSRYLHGFCGGRSEKRFVERLGDLFHEGYLDRPARQWDLAGARHRPAIHELGLGARRILLGREEEDTARTWLGPGPHRQFAHGVLVCELLASLELCVLRQPGLRFIAWPHILAKAPAEVQMRPRPFAIASASAELVPDALFGLAYEAAGRTPAYRFFALEADRGTMPIARRGAAQTSLAAKLLAYDAILARQAFRHAWAIPNLLVLVVTTAQSRIDALAGSKEVRLSCPQNFLFKVAHKDLARAPDVSLLATPWQRRALPPLDLGR